MSIETRTGRTRHRLYRPFLGETLLVLQVEILRTGYVAPGEQQVDYYWRDATVDDMNT